MSYIVTDIDFSKFKQEVLKFLTEEKYNEKNTSNKGNFLWIREIDGKTAVAGYGATGSGFNEILELKLNYLSNGEYICDIIGTYGLHSQIAKANVKFKYYNNNYVIYETSKISLENFNPYAISEYCVNLINATGNTAIDLAYNEPNTSESSRNSYEYTGEIVNKTFMDGDREFSHQYKIVNISYKSLVAFAKRYVSQEVFEKLIGYNIQNLNGKTGVIIESGNVLGRMVRTQGYELVKFEENKYTYHLNLNNKMTNFGATIVIEKVDGRYIVTSFEEEHIS